jgi:hypothetical protein
VLTWGSLGAAYDNKRQAGELEKALDMYFYGGTPEEREAGLVRSMEVQSQTNANNATRNLLPKFFFATRSGYVAILGKLWRQTFCK